jgi:hypothetical protein
LGEVVHTLVADSVDQLLNHDYRMRIDPSDPPAHDVHQARVATRRLRSNLKMLHSILDPRWVEETGADLEWLGTALLTQELLTTAERTGCSVEELQRSILHRAELVYDVSCSALGEWAWVSLSPRYAGCSDNNETVLADSRRYGHWL